MENYVEKNDQANFHEMIFRNNIFGIIIFKKNEK